MAASLGPDNVAAGSEEKGPTTATGGGSRSSTTCTIKPGVSNSASTSWRDSAFRARMVRAAVLVLMAAVAVAVPTLSLVRFHEHPMSQVWILSLSVCSYVFVFLMCIWRSRWFYVDFARLSYAPLLAFFSSCAIGPATAVFVLNLSTIWAAGNLGYSLAVHRLREGTEPAIHALPSHSCPTTRDTDIELNLNLYFGAPFVVLQLLLWTLIMASVVILEARLDELDILMSLSYFGWIHVTAWIIFVALMPMHGFPIEERTRWLVPALVIWMLVSPVICFVSQMLSVLCHLLLMVALVAFLWYNLAIYTHYLETAAPRPELGLSTGPPGH